MSNFQKTADDIRHSILDHVSNLTLTIELDGLKYSLSLEDVMEGNIADFSIYCHENSLSEEFINYGTKKFYDLRNTLTYEVNGKYT